MNHWDQYSEILSFILAPLALILITNGIQGLIENDTPKNLVDIKALGSALVSHVEYHMLIISGALLFTFVAWIISKS